MVADIARDGVCAPVEQNRLRGRTEIFSFLYLFSKLMARNTGAEFIPDGSSRLIPWGSSVSAQRRNMVSRK
jgi:hypothetical protein